MDVGCARSRGMGEAHSNGLGKAIRFMENHRANFFNYKIILAIIHNHEVCGISCIGKHSCA